MRKVVRMKRFIGILRGNLVGTIALVVALGGFAYASEHGNSVGAKALKAPKVLTADFVIPPLTDSGDVQIKCKSHQRFISGGYDSVMADAATPSIEVYTAAPGVNGRGNVNSFIFNGANEDPVESAAVQISAVCLPK